MKFFFKFSLQAYNKVNYLTLIEVMKIFLDVTFKPTGEVQCLTLTGVMKIFEVSLQPIVSLMVYSHRGDENL